VRVRGARLTASAARTLRTVAAVFEGAWADLGVDVLCWVLHSPQHGHARLELHLFPTALVHNVPARGVGRCRGPEALSRAARLAATVDERLGHALAVGRPAHD